MDDVDHLVVLFRLKVILEHFFKRYPTPRSPQQQKEKQIFFKMKAKLLNLILFLNLDCRIDLLNGLKNTERLIQDFPYGVSFSVLITRFKIEIKEHQEKKIKVTQKTENKSLTKKSSNDDK